MTPSHRAPVSPGEILAQEFLAPLGMTKTEFAAKREVPLQRVSQLVNGRRAVTAETALLLARVFKTSAEFWMNLQVRLDLWNAEATHRRRTG